MNAPYVLQYAYKRSTGPVVGAFLTALRDRRILGGRADDGRVICPPMEYDPTTGQDLGELVQVGPAGQIVTWSDGFALVRLDGADTALLHRLDVAEPAVGMRVAPRWAELPQGHIDDIEAFVAEGSAPATSPGPGGEPITRFLSPVRLDFTVTPGAALSRSLAGRRMSIS